MQSPAIQAWGSEKTLIVGNHRDNLRLLQHDFREPNAVRVARVLPGQIMPPVLRVPVDEAARKTFAQDFVRVNRL